MLCRLVPSRRWIGWFATFPARSHSATSTAPIERTEITRDQGQSALLIASRSSGSRPISSGFRKRISPGPSFAAVCAAEPRKAWPTTPSSVPISSRPSAEEPLSSLDAAW